MKAAPQIYNALTRLVIVAVISFVGYFTLAMVNLRTIHDRGLTDPSANMWILIVTSVGLAVRAMPVLLVLGVQDNSKAQRKASESASASKPSKPSGYSGYTGDD